MDLGLHFDLRGFVAKAGSFTRKNLSKKPQIF